MDLKKVPVGKNAPYDVNVIIEIPMGGNPVKYELDKALGAIFVDRFLHTAMYYPFTTASFCTHSPRTAIRWTPRSSARCR